MSQNEFKSFLNDIRSDFKIVIDDLFNAIEIIKDDIEKLKISNSKINKEH